MINYYKVPITQWAVEDRPREKLMKRGIDALTDAELIAILLGSGTREQSAIDLGRQLCEEAGTLGKLARWTQQDYCRIKGIGPAKAIALLAAFELGRRKGSSWEEKIRITNSEVVASYLINKIGDLNQEVFYVVFLNRNNEIQAEKSIFKGGVSATIIDPKIVFREAINQLASALIIAHNHPSGNLKPSQADIAITRKLVGAGKLFDINVLDHLIISPQGYFSMADEGMMGN